MPMPKINPITGHEDGLPDPRPRHEILRELLASHQVDPNPQLVDVLSHLQSAISLLRPFVDKEIEKQNRIYKRREREIRRYEQQVKVLAHKS